MEQNKPICQYCKGNIKMLKDSNHIIGCNLEAIAQILRWRGYELEATKLDEIASRIK
jgi:hypothetical protein